MNRIHEAFGSGKAFIPFITCGDPDLATTAAAVREAEKNGADLIELGIPFSDPTAEGPVIRAANERALAGGVTTDKIFSMVAELRGEVGIPLVFMTYANVVFSYGSGKFLARCRELGIDGLILPDLPFEEKNEFLAECRSYEVSLISMIAPTSASRIAGIAKEAEGFLYIVSSLGVTGVRNEIKTDLSAILRVVRQNTDLPAAIGFGISTPEQAKKMSELADGVIVGSAIVKLLEQYGTEAPQYIGRYIGEMKSAMSGAKQTSGRRMGVLGPRGTHSEAAASYLNRVTGESPRLVEYEEIHEVLHAVKDGRLDSCLVPVENSLEGSINITLDILARSDDLLVTRELIWPVHNYLMAKCPAEKVRRIYSHVQPISQCWNYLEREYPNAELIKVSSTAKAAQMVGEEPEERGAAAICTRLGGELQGLSVLAEKIEDNQENCTRFFEVRRRENVFEPQNADKILIICQIDGAKAGSLCEVLEEFARRKVNMTRIESRPARTELGAYIFFFELETNQAPEVMEAAIEGVRKKSIWLRHLGAFPVLNAAGQE